MDILAHTVAHSPSQPRHELTHLDSQSAGIFASQNSAINLMAQRENGWSGFRRKVREYDIPVYAQVLPLHKFHPHNSLTPL